MLDTGTATGEAAEHFPHYAEEGGPSPALLAYRADQIEATAGNLEVLDADIEAAERPVLTGTSGDLHTAIAEHARPEVVHNIRRVLQTSLVAAGATRLFGEDGVHAYDDLVDGLRTRYYERKAEIMASDCGIQEVSSDGTIPMVLAPNVYESVETRLASARQEQLGALVHELQQWQSRYREDPLEAQAALAASRLARADDVSVLQELFAAGGLPSAVAAAFPNVRFTFGELPSDIAEMDPDEILDHLLTHPGIAALLLPLLDAATRREMAERIVALRSDPSFMQASGQRDLNELARALGVGDLDQLTTDGIVFALNRPDIPAEERERILRTVQEEYGDLIGMSDSNLAEHLLDNPGAPEDVMTWLQAVRPGALEAITDDWRLPKTIGSSNGFAPLTAETLGGRFCDDSLGMIVGPDGRTYIVTIPQEGGDEISADDPPDMLSNTDGWATIHWQVDTIVQGGEHAGIEGMRDAHIVASQGGLDPTTDAEYHSLGRDQEEYLVIRGDGSVSLNEEAPVDTRLMPQQPFGVPAPPAPELPGSQTPDVVPQVGRTRVDVPPSTTSMNTSAGLGMGRVAVDALDGLNNAEIAENDRYGSVQTVFQENEAGERRAVVVYRQVLTNGEDDVIVDSTYAGYNEDGDLSSYLRDEDGAIYEVNDPDPDDD